MYGDVEDTQYDQESPERDSALTRLDEEIKRLHASIEHLTKRLDPILMNHPEADNADNIKAIPESGLRERVGSLTSAISRLERLARNLDI